MTFEDFDKLFDEFFKECRDVGEKKGKEYSHSEDRLGNFKRIAEELEIDPRLVCYIYMKKHWDSITSYTKIGRELSDEKIRGRLKDLVVYAILYLAIDKEMNQS